MSEKKCAHFFLLIDKYIIKSMPFREMIKD